MPTPTYDDRLAAAKLMRDVKYPFALHIDGDGSIAVSKTYSISSYMTLSGRTEALALRDRLLELFPLTTHR
jgi:hypothetical protein